MRHMIYGLIAILILFGLMSTNLSSQDKTPPKAKYSLLGDIEQKLVGLDDKLPKGKLVKVRISDLPKDTEGVVTAVYKIALLENGKVSDNAECLTSTERNNEEKDAKKADFIFAIKCQDNVRYQVIFMVTYIETKKDNIKEIMAIRNPDAKLYDVKVDGTPVPNPDPIDPVDPVDPIVVPDGDFKLIKTVYDNILKIKTEKPQIKKLCIALKDASSGMAAKIAAGVYKDSNDTATQTANIEKFLKDAKKANNDAVKSAGVDPNLLDAEYDDVIKAVFEKLWKEGKMRKFADYQQAWAEQSVGYDYAAKSIK